MADVRAFIAVELPDPVLAMLERVQSALGRSLPRGAVRWVRPAGIHLTLKFLGNVPETQVASIIQTLDAVSAREQSLRLETAGLGYFPPRGALRVLWLGVAGDVAALGAVQRRLELAVAPLGFPPESRAYSPHLTLGRVREGATPEEQRAIVQALAHVAPEAPLPVPVQGLTLFESRLQPGGAVYRVLHHAAFSAADSAAGN